MSAAPQAQEYGASQITVLKGLDPVRKRPGMYIGNTSSRGFHHCLWEVVDNSVDEAMAGYCDRVVVTLNPDNSVTVEDNGRGIPTEIHPEEGKPAVEIALTVLHAGGKFDKNGYAYSGGLHGVGISVVNALSKWVRVTVRRDGEESTIGFGLVEDVTNGVVKEIPGVVTEPLHRVRSINKKITGTTVTFLLDENVFSTTEWNIELIKRRLRQTSFLNAGLTCVLRDHRTDEHIEVEYHHPGGIVEFMNTSSLARRQELEAKQEDGEPLPALLEHPILLEGEEIGVGEWRACLQWNPDTRTTVDSFVNGIETPDGGTHVDGVLKRFAYLVNRYCRQEHVAILGPKDPNLEGQDLQSGMGLIVAAKVLEPEFEGQTKGRLGNQAVYKMVQSGFQAQFLNWIEHHPSEFRVVLDKSISEMRLRHRLADAEARERAGQEKRGFAARSLPLPVKLVDCESRDRDQCELFIVEGDSAAGPAKKTRSRNTQAVLPIRGKGINVERASNDAIANNREVQGMIAALGAGSEDNFDLSACRYGKIIILTDADDDGRHIQILLMTMFFRLMRPLVEAGRLYVARPPLYGADHKGGKIYVHTVEERDRVDAEIKNLNWTRFKGLGEMDSSDLQRTAIDPATRSIAQITIDDLDSAADTITRLMGNNSATKWEALVDLELDLAEVTSA